MKLNTQPEPRPAGQHHVLKLTSEPLETVRIGMIGLGVRAKRAVNRLIHIEGAEIKALCDIIPQNIEHAQEVLKNNGKPLVQEYAGIEAWKQMCEQPDIDLIYICTDWKTHTPMTVYAMECGKHVAIEVPAATTVKECWQLVNTAERTRRHCMMLENCCYDFFEMATLYMAQEGLFGEILHVEGAYIHDLRERIFTGEYGMRLAGDWQTEYNIRHTGNPYPTHGLGPLCQLLNIHRGDKMNHLVSMSTKSAGMALYAREKYGENSMQALYDYKLGDMNTSLIHTESGKTILLQYNVSTPRPYSRIHLINGTKGYAQKYPVQQLAFYPSADDVLNAEEIQKILEKYTHPFWNEMGSKAVSLCGKRACDYIMDSRLIYCLRKGLPLDMDVYDAAEWSCLVELTEFSVKNGNIPVQIPDFTRGKWNKPSDVSF